MCKYFNNQDNKALPVQGTQEIVDAPCLCLNQTLHTDFVIPYIKESNKQKAKEKTMKI